MWDSRLLKDCFPINESPRRKQRGIMMDYNSTFRRKRRGTNPSEIRNR